MSDTLVKMAEQALAEQIERIMAMPAGSDVAEANQHLLALLATVLRLRSLLFPPPLELRKFVTMMFRSSVF